MPLAAIPASAERHQTILFDPASPEERRDMRRRYRELRKRGFARVSVAPGEIVLRPPPRASHDIVFRALTENGDDVVVWDRRDPKQVKEAFKRYKELVDMGYTAYATTSDGKKGHRIDGFDPGLEEILFVPATRPG